MSNLVYPKFKGSLMNLASATGLLAYDIKVALMSAAYVPSVVDQFLSDVSGVVSTCPNLTGKTISADGIFGSDDPTFTAVTGDDVVGFLIYVDTGSPGSSRLVAYRDSDLTGFPFTPAGFDKTLTLTSAGWFKL